MFQLDNVWIRKRAHTTFDDRITFSRKNTKKMKKKTTHASW